MNPILRNSCLAVSGAMLLAQAAAAGQPITLRQGESRRFMLNDNRSISISCTRNGGRQTAREIALAAGRSTQVMLYRDRSPTTVSCDDRIALPNPRIPGPGRDPRHDPRDPRTNPYPGPANPYPGNPYPGSSYGMDIAIFSNDDSCSGTVSGYATLIADVDLMDQCANLNRTSSSQRAWSVKANGVCRNIEDTDVVSACLNVRVPSYRGAAQVVVFANSDSCSGAVSAAGYIDTRYSTYSQCQALKQNGSLQRAWSVRVDDRCINVQDTDFVSACISAL